MHITKPLNHQLPWRLDTVSKPLLACKVRKQTLTQRDNGNETSKVNAQHKDIEKWGGVLEAISRLLRLRGGTKREASGDVLWQGLELTGDRVLDEYECTVLAGIACVAWPPRIPCHHIASLHVVSTG